MKPLVACGALLLFVSAGSLRAHGPWQVIPNCHLVPNASNDGDSFHASAGGQEYIFRLYFVDTPETDESFPDRVDEQAKYFRLTHEQTTRLGELAKHFTNEKLARAFTVRTCMQDALGRSRKERFYAFIGTDEGDLGELLVANGMARLHGTQGQPVGLSSPQVEWQKLERLENEAKAAKVGGWGAPVGRMTARLPKTLSTTGADSFDAWFHPARVGSRSEAVTVVAPTATPFGVHGSWPFEKVSPTPSATPAPVATSKKESRSPTTSTKLNPNTATASELIALPGIGPTMADRIIANRPFKSADDLRAVKGIGPKKYERIRPYFE